MAKETKELNQSIKIEGGLMAYIIRYAEIGEDDLELPFEVWPVIGEDTDGIQLTSLEMDVNPTPLWKGEIKWDGCADFDIEPGSNARFHTCGPYAFRDWPRLLQELDKLRLLRIKRALK